MAAENALSEARRELKKLRAWWRALQLLAVDADAAPRDTHDTNKGG